jgi:ATP-dependent exoDNAse (exonuclease V) beta subunit
VKVELDKSNHIYTSDTGVVFKSVSKLIDQFVPFFDFDQKSYDYSIKYGIPVEEVRAGWKEKNKLSTDYGHKIHTIIEENIRVKNYHHKDKIYDIILKNIKNLLTGKEEILSEKIIFNEDFKIAGTSDLILERKDNFDVIDFKTNKNIKYDNRYDDPTLLFPVNHLPNAEYFKYALQLSLYAYIHELKTGKRAYRLIIFWFKRKKKEDYNCMDGEWVKLSVPYLKEEAKLVLEYGAKK